MLKNSNAETLETLFCNEKVALTAKEELEEYRVRVETIAGDIGKTETVDKNRPPIAKDSYSQIRPTAATAPALR